LAQQFGFARGDADGTEIFDQRDGDQQRQKDCRSRSKDVFYLVCELFFF